MTPRGLRVDAEPSRAGSIGGVNCAVRVACGSQASGRPVGAGRGAAGRSPACPGPSLWPVRALPQQTPGPQRRMADQQPDVRRKSRAGRRIGPRRRRPRTGVFLKKGSLTKESVMGIIAWIVLGLAAGLLANMLIPGRRSQGLILTCVIGIVGALLGGWVATKLFHIHSLQGFFNLSTW